MYKGRLRNLNAGLKADSLRAAIIGSGTPQINDNRNCRRAT
jgi:hypothetical protein